jgi:hypothetical protein
LCPLVHIQMLFEAKPNLASLVDKTGRLLLHYVVGRDDVPYEGSVKKGLNKFVTTLRGVSSCLMRAESPRERPQQILSPAQPEIPPDIKKKPQQPSYKISHFQRIITMSNGQFWSTSH